MKPLAVTKRKIDSKAATPLIDTAFKAIVASVNPLEIYLFGSASEDRLSDQSDLDFLVVYDDSKPLKELKKKYYSTRPPLEISIDIVWVSSSEFERKRNLGGVCMTASQQGKMLYRRGEK